MRLIYILSVVLLVSCAGVKKNGTKSINAFIFANFSEQAVIAPNSTEDFVLGYTIQKGTLMQPGNRLEYIIVDVAEGKIVFRETKFNASVKWYNDLYIKVDSSPEVRSKSDDVNRQMKVYYINVKTLNKLTDLPN